MQLATVGLKRTRNFLAIQMAAMNLLLGYMRMHFNCARIKNESSDKTVKIAMQYVF